MTQLRELRVKGVPLPAARLKEALPGCKIH